MLVLELEDKEPKEILFIQMEQDPRQAIYNEAVAKGFKGTFEEFYKQTAQPMVWASTNW